mgnify:FL=1
MCMYWFYKDKRFRVEPDKCGCGGTPKIEFNFKFDPYRWRVYCPECGETTDTHYERSEAIFAWNRRGGKKMAVEIKKRKYCVLKEGREYNSYSMTDEYSNLDDAIKRAESCLEIANGDKRIMVIEIIAKSKTTRQLVFTGDEE